jgi:hypothetical protein
MLNSFGVLVCSDAFAQCGSYIHHYPHYNKVHDYHEPGFQATLEHYKKVRCRFFFLWVNKINVTVCIRHFFWIQHQSY